MIVSPVSDVPPIVNWVVVATTVSEAIAVPDDTAQRGAVPHVLPKLMTQEVRTPPPATTVPKLSPPETVGEVPQLELVGEVPAPANKCVLINIAPMPGSVVVPILTPPLAWMRIASAMACVLFGVVTAVIYEPPCAPEVKAWLLHINHPEAG